VTNKVSQVQAEQDNQQNYSFLVFFVPREHQGFYGNI